MAVVMVLAFFSDFVFLHKDQNKILLKQEPRQLVAMRLMRALYSQKMRNK
jgi:hypothetical protein